MDAPIVKDVNSIGAARLRWTSLLLRTWTFFRRDLRTDDGSFRRLTLTPIKALRLFNRKKSVALCLMISIISTWNFSPGNWAISRTDLPVWSAALDQPAEVVPRLHSLLAPDERARADRFHFDRDRRRFIVARGVLRSILGGYLYRAPDRLTFHYGPQGKPGLSLAGESRLHFNVAHSHELAVYVFAQNQAVGIDCGIHTAPHGGC